MLTPRATKYLCLLITQMATSSAFALSGHYYASTSLGVSSAGLSQHSPQITYANGTLIDDYPLNGTTASAGIFSLNAGYELAGERLRPAIQIGLGAYADLPDRNFQGQLIETALGDASNALYQYQYQVQNTRLLGELQFTWQNARIAPFLQIGAGLGWTRMSNYIETPLTTNGYAALSPFQANTNVNFAYQIGLGLSTAFSLTKTADFPSERVSLGYRYANLGQTNFGTRGSTYPYELKTGVLTTNDIYLSYTHLF